MGEIREKSRLINKKWFYFLSLYLVIEYTRIHDLIGIGFLKPGFFVTIILFLFIFSNKCLSFTLKRQNKVMILFIFLLMCYIPIARNNFFAYHAFKVMVILIPTLLSIAALINTQYDIRKIFWLFAVIVAFNSIYSIFYGGRGPGGVVMDENDIGLFFVTFLPFLFFLFYIKRSHLEKSVLILIIIFTSISIIKTFSRGTFVGLLVMGLIYWLFSKKKIKILIIGIIFGLFFIHLSGEDYLNEISTITDTSESTAQSRLLSWRAGWDMFLDNPLGVGGGNFPVLFPKYQPEEFQKGMWGRVAHSLWYTLLPETGLIGVFLFAIIIAYNLKDVFYLRKLSKNVNSGQTIYFFFPLSTAFIASMGGFFASSTFISVLYYPHFWILSSLILAARSIADRCAQEMPVDDTESFMVLK